MSKILEYSGHIRNWKSLCDELGIDNTLSREERENEIILKAYEVWVAKWQTTFMVCLHLLS